VVEAFVLRLPGVQRSQGLRPVAYFPAGNPGARPVAILEVGAPLDAPLDAPLGRRAMPRSGAGGRFGRTC